MTKTVIHFGESITRFIIDHNINVDLWKNIFDQINGMKIWKDTKLSQKHKIYQHDNLVYEYNLNDDKCVCYTEKPTNLQMLKLIDSQSPFKVSLTYALDQTILSDCDFQPINKYYNVHEIERHEFSTQSMSLIFEKKGDTHEIKMFIEGNNWIENEKYLRSVIKFQKMVFDDC